MRCQTRNWFIIAPLPAEKADSKTRERKKQMNSIVNHKDGDDNSTFPYFCRCKEVQQGNQGNQLLLAASHKRKAV